MMGFSTEESLNQIPAAGHKGRHRTKYHDRIYSRLTDAISEGATKGGFRGARRAFVRQLIDIRKELTANPGIIRSGL